MAIASSELVEREIRIEAPPSVVFEFLTDPAKMVRWMGTEAVLEPWPGGRYYVNLNGHEGASGEVLEIIPERRLVFSWGWADGSLPLRPGQSTVEGVFVTPGLNVATPVGAAGVPPQVQNVSPWPAVALPVVARSPTAVVAITSATTRDLIGLAPFVGRPGLVGLRGWAEV